MIKMEEWSMIRQMYNQGLSKSEISRTLGLDRKTVSKAIRSDKSPVYTRPKVISKLEPYKKYISERLELYSLTSKKILREIVSQGFNGSYETVNSYVKEIKQDYKTKAVLRFETLPGEQAQVDWGYFGDFYDHETKKVIRLCCFLMVLGYSRMRFIHFFDGDNTDNFLLGHNLAFKYFGGYTREILYDNLKSVVIKRAFKQQDSEFNKRFLEYSGFYGFKGVLARPYRPQTKGKVENAVRFVREDFFLGESFQSLTQMNESSKIWLDRVNNQIHASTHEEPQERLKREGLLPLVKEYDLSKIYYRKIFQDSHFSFKGNFYSVPPEYVLKEVIIKQNESEIFVYYRGEVIAYHSLELQFKGGYITSPSDFVRLRELALRRSKQKPKEKNQNKIEREVTPLKTDFDSTQIIQLFQDVDVRDLSAYQEGIL